MRAVEDSLLNINDNVFLKSFFSEVLVNELDHINFMISFLGGLIRGLNTNESHSQVNKKMESIAS